MSGGLGEFTGVGPVQARAEALLRETVDEGLEASMAQRSPVGPRAVIVRPAGDADRDTARRLAERLEGEEWVDEVAPRPRHVYVRVSTDALREWVADGFAEAGVASGTEGAGRPAAVRAAGEHGGDLRLFREAAVGRSIAALLRSRGFEPVGAADGTATVVVGSAPVTGDAVHAPVGEVDVRHGPLRARHGGSVSADDLLDELAVEHGEGAEALLSFLLLRTERARRLQLDDEKLRREAAAFEGVLGARRLAERGGSAGAEEPIRDLAAELDMLPIAAARAASALEPAIVTRFIRTIAERSLAAESSLPASDALWSAVGEAIDVALELAGIEVPRGVWCATSQAGVEPEKSRPWAGLAAPTGDDGAGP